MPGKPGVAEGRALKGRFSGWNYKEVPDKKGKVTSMVSIFFMSLFDRQDLLDNYQLFLFIDFIENGILSGDVKPVDDYPAFQDKFLFISPASRERVFLKPLQGSFYYPACLYGQAIDLIR